ncbi:hypothetical protein OZX62_08850 [Bifidobacterium sp. ESL0690]|uniref:hypothetical protein n=1 Tax=Bifidobacterium sp. ESL0690 TaxID=2983214 RepID=UPI0023F66FC0|nr:hypothetical protein [Bifidobacterium sp. ESL0690]WEV46527.1 hypothetical protein OZX62_08850 [Bifidobacterium sp. ESL0690]
MEITIHTDVLDKQIKKLQTINVKRDNNTDQVGDGSSIEAIALIDRDFLTLQSVFDNLVSEAIKFFQQALKDYEKADEDNAKSIENSLDRSPVPAPKQDK